MIHRAEKIGLSSFKTLRRTIPSLSNYSVGVIVPADNGGTPCPPFRGTFGVAARLNRRRLETPFKAESRPWRFFLVDGPEEKKTLFRPSFNLDDLSARIPIRKR